MIKGLIFDNLNDFEQTNNDVYNHLIECKVLKPEQTKKWSNPIIGVDNKVLMVCDERINVCLEHLNLNLVDVDLNDENFFLIIND